MRPTSGTWDAARAQALARNLLGTCLLLPDYWVDNLNLCLYLDELVIRCACCDWWYKAPDIGPDGNCGRCHS